MSSLVTCAAPVNFENNNNENINNNKTVGTQRKLIIVNCYLV